MAYESWIMGLISFIEAKILDSNEELKFSIEKIYYEKYFNRSKTNISAPNVIDFNLHPYLWQFCKIRPKVFFPNIGVHISVRIIYML